MSKCLIFGALPTEKVNQMPSEGDLVIAADGGLKYAEELDITPDVIVGDFDSLGYVPTGDGVIRLPVRKDDTDIGYAVFYALSKGYRLFDIYGGIGGKFDHSIANVQIAASISKKGGRANFYYDGGCMTAICDGSITATGKGRLSVFAYNGEAEGVTINGSDYDVNDIILSPYYPLGVSNSFKKYSVSVSVKSGILVIVYEC